MISHFLRISGWLGGFLLLALASSVASAQASILPGFTVQKVASSPGFLSSIAFNPSNVLYFSNLDGKIYRVDSGISVEVARVETANIGNEGLLGIAFLTERQLVAHHVLPDHTADVLSLVDVVTGVVRELVRFECDRGLPCPSEHHGGNPIVGPDGSIFVGIGDYGEASLAQLVSSPAGKIFRVTTDGSFSIFALGFRNPFDLVYDIGRRKLIVTDNGPTGGDEIHVIGEGDNAGWPLTVGDQPGQPGLVSPVYTFPKTVAPTGISQLRKKGAIPFDGLLVGGFVTKTVYYFPASLAERLPSPVPIVEGVTGSIIDVSQDGNGEIFYASGSSIYHLGVPLRGDANGDGRIDEMDYAALWRELEDGLGEETIRAQDGAYAASWGADANGDGVIDRKDLVALSLIRPSRPRTSRHR